MRLLHVFLELDPTSPEYNEHCLPQLGRHDIGICTFFPPSLDTPAEIRLHPGDGTVRTFLSNVKHALDLTDYDIIHLHSVHVAFLLLLASGARRRAPLRTVYTFHDSYPNYKLRNRILLRPVFVWARRIVCCGRASRESVPRLLERLAGRRLTYVQNGVDLSRIDRALTGTTRESSGLTVVSIGRMQPVKNHETTVRAFAACTDENDRLFILGDGPVLEPLRERVRTLGLGERVHAPGIIPRDDVFRLLGGADLFVSASQGEGLPVAVLEAMACRCAVVLSDIPPHREIAEGTDFIPLVAPRDVAGFAAQIGRFAGMAAEELFAIGEQCRRLVEERFSLERMQAGYLGIYQQLLDGGPGS